MTTERRPAKNGGARITMVDAEDEGYAGPAETTPLVDGHTPGDEQPNGHDKPSEDWAGHTDFAGLPWYKRPSVFWLVGPYFLFTLAFGGSIVPRLNLIVDLVCRHYFAERQLEDPTLEVIPVLLGGDNRQCKLPEVQKHVASFTLVLSVLTGALSAISAPKLGSWSDRYGRTKLLVVASFGGVLNEVITIIAARYPDLVDFRWMVLGAFLDGITGSMTAGSLLAHSYVADCSPPAKRSVNMGYLYGCLFTGLAFGPIIGGYLAKWTGTLLAVFYVTLGCHLFFILFILIVAPESLSKRRQTAAREKHKDEQEAAAIHLRRNLPDSVANIVGPQLSAFLSDHMGSWLPALLSANPLAPLRIFFPSGPENKGVSRNLIIFAMIDTIIMGTALSLGTIVVLYSEFMFDWGTLETSIFVSVVSLVRVFVLLGVFPVVAYLVRSRRQRRRAREVGSAEAEDESQHQGADLLDVWTLRVALLSDVLGIIGYTVARSGPAFIGAGIVAAFGGLGSAVIQSAMSKHVPSERVGSLLGGMGLLHALSRVVAPIVYNGVYAATVETFPQAIFVVLIVIFGLSLVASFFLRPKLFMKEEGYVRLPVRNVDETETPEHLASEEIPSETLPRI